MKFSHLKDKPDFQRTVWDIMEDAQNIHPYYWLGWDGYVLFVYWV